MTMKIAVDGSFRDKYYEFWGATTRHPGTPCASTAELWAVVQAMVFMRPYATVATSVHIFSDDETMTLHMYLFRDYIKYSHRNTNAHPFLMLPAENSPEEFLSLIHYYHLTRRTTSSHSLARYKVGIDPKSTLDNVILHWYT